MGRLHPGRRFYITGHSLGGGIAKLVAGQIDHSLPSKELVAVAFSGPGLAFTTYNILGYMLDQNYSRASLTVKPTDDVVSQIDSQVGATIPIQCKGDALYCHDLFHTLCSLYATCGSMRPEGTLSMPCGRCKDM